MLTNLFSHSMIPNMSDRQAQNNFIICASGSVGGARPCQGRGRGFESRLALFYLWQETLIYKFSCFFYCNIKVDYIRNKKSPVKLDFLLMPAMGLEPIRCCHRQILSLVRLPFRHAGLFRFQIARTIDILSYHVVNCKQFYFNIC